MRSIVRSSKYRHVFGKESKPEHNLSGVKYNVDSNDSHTLNCNSKYLAIHWDSHGSGEFLIRGIEKGDDCFGGKLIGGAMFCGHEGGPVLCSQFNPFDEQLLASAGYDGNVCLWSMNGIDGLQENDFKEFKRFTNPNSSIRGVHDRKIISLNWHPTANGILASASHDLSSAILDVEKGVKVCSLEGHYDNLIDQCWNTRGSLLASTAKDKQMLIHDPRTPQQLAGKIENIHSRGGRIVWTGDNKIISCGFGMASERVCTHWDIRKFDGGGLCGGNAAVWRKEIDISSGPLMPFWDGDCKILYLAGKGDGNIRYYELEDNESRSSNEKDGEDQLHFLSEYKSTVPQAALAALPKISVDRSQNEIQRFYKCMGNRDIVESISFRVPRKTGSCSADIYPDPLAMKPLMSSVDYLEGEEIGEPIRGSFEDLPVMNKQASSMPDIKSSEESKADLNNENDTAEIKLERLIIENEKLQHKVKEQAIKIRQLEGKLKSSSAEM